ncbi:hypothetical protein MRX96_035984 [Rhipicephalus microplus]
MSLRTKAKAQLPAEETAELVTFTEIMNASVHSAEGSVIAEDQTELVTSPKIMNESVDNTEGSVFGEDQTDHVTFTKIINESAYNTYGSVIAEDLTDLVRVITSMEIRNNLYNLATNFNAVHSPKLYAEFDASSLDDSGNL